MGQRPANGLTAEAEAAVERAIVRLREKLRPYDRRGRYGELTLSLKITNGRVQKIRTISAEDDLIESA